MYTGVTSFLDMVYISDSDGTNAFNGFSKVSKHILKYAQLLCMSFIFTHAITNRKY